MKPHTVIVKGLTILTLTLLIISLTSINTINAKEAVKVWEINVKDLGYDASSIAWSPNGKYIAVGGSDCVMLYKFKGDKPIWLVRNNKANAAGFLPSIAWSPDGSKIIVFSIMSYDSTDDAFITMYSNNSEELWKGVIWDAGEKYYEAYFKLWGIERKKLTLIAYSCKLDILCVYKLTGNALLEIWRKDFDYTVFPTLHPNGSIIALFSYRDGKIYFYDVESGEVIATSKNAYPTGCTGFRYSYSGKYIALIGEEDILIFSDRGDLLYETKLAEDVDLVKLLWITDDYIVVGSRKGYIYIFRWHDNKLTPIYGLEVPRIWDIDVSPDGKYLAVATGEKVIVYDISGILTLTTAPGLDVDIVVTMTTTTTETETKTVTRTTTIPAITTHTIISTIIQPSTTTITSTITKTEIKTETTTTTITITETKGLSIETALLIAVIAGIIGYIIGRKS